jgi:deoxyribodipyrimidine photo-lyase
MKPILLWFRQDLRLADNPALHHAVRTGRKLICLFVLDDETPGRWPWGGASRWWLHHALDALDKALAEKGGRLILRRGKAAAVVKQVVRETGADAVVWNRCYEPFAVTRDTGLKSDLAAAGIAVDSFNGALLFEPWEIATEAGKPYRVFTPFWRALRARTAPGKPQTAPRVIAFAGAVAGDRLADWALAPAKPDWAEDFPWTPGEAAAQRSLRRFLARMKDYAGARDIPGEDGTSRLSAHLHWGEISPRQIWHAVRGHEQGDGRGAETFLKELGWREFCCSLLFHHPDLPQAPLDRRFADFPWASGDDRAFKAWTEGRTGIPIVDAGMRQLWRTGWMHNRVRMIVASFLVKHLLIDWRVGQTWFWDTLVDADLANNAANWQWVVGCGADAAPFFRIFNPVLQGEKFDPGGAYVRAFVPELKHLPDKFIHKPWTAPEPPAGYPKPVVDLAQGRARALKAFQSLPKSKS